MARDDFSIADAVIRKLERFAALSEDERAAVRLLQYRSGTAAAGQLLVEEGRRAAECCVLLSGYACRHKTTRGGGRQIVSFHIPGDLLDLQHLLFARTDHNVQAITPASVAWVGYDSIRQLFETRPAIAAALWADTLVEASIFREWVLNIGRRDAKSRLAHLLCEFVARCQDAGIGSPEHFRLPMTQEDIADATGLTTVHINRMFSALRAEGVIAGTGKQVEIADWDRLRHVADFDPAYLHLAA